MLQILADLRDDVVGSEAVGKFEADDYDGFTPGAWIWLSGAATWVYHERAGDGALVVAGSMYAGRTCSRRVLA